MSSDGGSLLFKAIRSEITLSADEKRALRVFARELSHTVIEGRTFCCVITDDKELHRLNREFLHHDYPTDVLSFPQLESNGQLGELAISIERARAQADEFGHSLVDELRILMLHGVLHLAGFDHERDLGEMARTEHRLRRTLGLPAGLIARARR
jgi:probable rRNA maturation factor